MYQKILTTILLCASLLLVGQGITGFYTLDYTQELCQVDSDCSYSVCCPVYGEEYGVCDQESNCDGIYLATRNTVESGNTESSSVLRTASVSDIEEEASQSYIALALGLIILLVVAVVSYVEWHQHKESKKKVKKVSKKKTKKRKKKKARR